MTPTPPTTSASPRPPAWRDLLSDADWCTAVRAIGVSRLLELRPVLAQVSPAFRTEFIRQLDATARGLAENRAVLLALARAADDAGRRACAARHRPFPCRDADERTQA
jgi:hypothetical protein